MTREEFVEIHGPEPLSARRAFDANLDALIAAAKAEERERLEKAAKTAHESVVMAHLHVPLTEESMTVHGYCCEATKALVDSLTRGEEARER